MNQYILLAILLIAFAFWTFKKSIATTGIPQIRPLEAKNRLDSEKGIILLDVRTKEEYLERRIPKSNLIPLNVLTKEASIKLPDKNAEIFVYCRSGSRSAIAVNTLLKLGYTHVYNLGGIISWPYETESGQ